MPQTGLIPNAHQDLVTDTAYDFYGLRLATCALDQRIKVWHSDESNGKWQVEDDWKAHEAPVSRLSWAHPEFGTILASSSYDRTVKIWEQIAPLCQQDSSVNGTSHSQSPSGPPNSRWVERAVLTDARGTVRAVEFAPHHFGLKLATIASDNYLRVYECLEQPSLTTWQLTEEFDVQNLPSPSASPSPHSKSQAIALATPTQANPTVDSASMSLVSQALQQNPAGTPTTAIPLPPPSATVRLSAGNREADGGWCISWCKDRYWGETIAAGCGTSGIVKIIQLSPSRRPTCVLTLDPAPSSSAPQPVNPSAPANTDPPPSAMAGGDSPAIPSGDSAAPAPSFSISSVSWAPSCGRSYHLVATGGRDGHVRIWRIKPGDELDSNDEDVLAEEEGGGDRGKWTASIVADFTEHKSAVGRVEWNITGTVLSSAGNDGRIRLWKATSGSVWRPAGSIGVEQVEENDGAETKDVEMH